MSQFAGDISGSSSVDSVSQNLPTPGKLRQVAIQVGERHLTPPTDGRFNRGCKFRCTFSLAWQILSSMTLCIYTTPYLTL